MLDLYLGGLLLLAWLLAMPAKAITTLDGDTLTAPVSAAPAVTLLPALATAPATVGTAAVAVTTDPCEAPSLMLAPTSSPDLGSMEPDSRADERPNSNRVRRVECGELPSLSRTAPVRGPFEWRIRRDQKHAMKTEHIGKVQKRRPTTALALLC